LVRSPRDQKSSAGGSSVGSGCGAGFGFTPAAGGFASGFFSSLGTSGFVPCAGGGVAVEHQPEPFIAAEAFASRLIGKLAIGARHSGEHPPATPREVEDYYNKNVDKWREGDQIKISTITIPKFSGEAGSSSDKQKKLAQELRSKILNGGGFASAAKAYSQDSRAENGGSWDWMAKTDMMPAIANAAMALKTGGISPVLDQEASYIIVACDAKKLGIAPPLDKMRPEIEKMINQEKSKDNIDKWMESIRKKHVIKRF
jgi:hypothetical protein